LIASQRNPRPSGRGGCQHTNPVDVGWVVGFLLIGLGALWSRVGAGLELQDVPVSRNRQVIPYFPVVATALVAGYSGITGRGWPVSSPH
jgi:hypothetical protein